MQKGCEHPLSNKLSIVNQSLKCIMGVMWVVEAPLKEHMRLIISNSLKNICSINNATKYDVAKSLI
jgi:hypothetical protein